MLSKAVRSAAAVATTFLALSGCSKIHQEPASGFDADKMSYDIDTRTGFCFAVAASQSQGINIVASPTRVPCTKEALSLIKSEKVETTRRNGHNPTL